MANEDNPAGFLFAKVKRSSARALATRRLPSPPVDTSYPTTREFEGPGRLCPYDVIVINRVSMPLHNSKAEGGTKLDVDKQKSQGTDYPSVVGKGYDVVPVHFTLLLFDDVLTGTNWLERYESRVRDVLMPQKKLDKRNAVEVYYPMLAGDRIHTVVVTKRDTPKFAGKQMWTVEVEGLDLRAIKVGAATKKMAQDTALKARPTVLGQTGGTPADARKGQR